ncbi:uncharacterized protein B0H18DRAFT_958201 [Fomitopsis serialis]|uniref:uncharacterized protein n=1 Tax=Fomitopsis serialis TaxID=139415 RepID=UPI002007EAB4|nr:uncharacterized protein B0H18DRAFT_958201 [Neoantrodia serialis]KAH9917759.1 hypothetical protein B0H18DRAFT_958201 [Neoantrodia serialis]
MKDSDTIKSTGPSATLISRIDHLAALLGNLPKALPENPVESTYHFGLDPEDEAEEGVWYAFNRNMEVSFETYKAKPDEPLRFRERGKRCSNLITVMKLVVKKMSDSDREFVRKTWLERLIVAAKLSGAVVPKSKAHRGN